MAAPDFQLKRDFAVFARHARHDRPAIPDIIAEFRLLPPVVFCRS